MVCAYRGDTGLVEWWLNAEVPDPFILHLFISMDNK